VSHSPVTHARGRLVPWEREPLTWWDQRDELQAHEESGPAGSFVTHFAKQVHWDGAKDEDAILLIMGEGPATSTAAEEK
jgi:hypothetical protein